LNGLDGNFRPPRLVDDVARADRGTRLASFDGRMAPAIGGKKQPLEEGDDTVETLLQVTPAFAAIGYSLVYLLAGGGFFGAFVIFVVAKMLGR
jgi:hypothetical protein